MSTACADWLDARCQEVSALEARGKAAIAASDAETYREVMRQKAELLEALFKNATPCAEGLPPKQREAVLKQLKQFSASARQALALDSVFYMSALLYRDDHKEGEPNNLELLRDRIRSETAETADA